MIKLYKMLKNKKILRDKKEKIKAQTTAKTMLMTLSLAKSRNILEKSSTI